MSYQPPQEARAEAREHREGQGEATTKAKSKGAGEGEAEGPTQPEQVAAAPGQPWPKRATAGTEPGHRRATDPAGLTAHGVAASAGHPTQPEPTPPDAAVAPAQDHEHEQIIEQCIYPLRIS